MRDYLVIKRENNVVTEIMENASSDEAYAKAQALDKGDPKVTYQVVTGLGIKDDYAVGQVGDEFDLLDDIG